MSNFKSNVLTAALFTAATVQTLAKRGGRFYANNEEEILAKATEATLCFLTGLSVIYDRTRSAAIATYQAGVAARGYYTEYAPEVKAQAAVLKEQAEAFVATLRARFAQLRPAA